MKRYLDYEIDDPKGWLIAGCRKCKKVVFECALDSDAYIGDAWQKDEPTPNAVKKSIIQWFKNRARKQPCPCKQKGLYTVEIKQFSSLQKKESVFDAEDFS